MNIEIDIDWVRRVRTVVLVMVVEVVLLVELDLHSAFRVLDLDNHLAVVVVDHILHNHLDFEVVVHCSHMARPTVVHH